jgi:ribosome maturation factor RimP
MPDQGPDKADADPATDRAPAAEPSQAGLEGRIASAITPSLEGLGYELVRVLVLGRERPTVQIMADRADGSMINVEDCERITHAVGAVLDVDDPLPGAWTLEVSSAGIDRPLTRLKDWVRFTGHLARVEMLAPLEGRRRFSGVILGAATSGAGLGHAKLRLDDGTDLDIPLADLRRAKLVLTDALIEATAPPVDDQGDTTSLPN